MITLKIFDSDKTLIDTIKIEHQRFTVETAPGRLQFLDSQLQERIQKEHGGESSNHLAAAISKEILDILYGEERIEITTTNND